MNKKQTEEEALEPIVESSAPSPETTEEPSLQPQPEPVVEPPAQEEESVKNQLLRLQADFDNFRKRTQRERSELFQLANEALFLEMLPVMDHFEMGFKSAEEHQSDCSVTAGFRLVYNQLLDVLKKFNVTAMAAVGEPFNPHRHEALLHRPSDQPAETVIEQVRCGYLLGDKLLRAAQVIISSGSPEGA